MKEQRAVTSRDRLKNVDIPVLILQKVLQANKIISKNKNIFLPIYPNLTKHVTGNTHIFLLGLRLIYLIAWQQIRLSDFLVHFQIQLIATVYHRSCCGKHELTLTLALKL